MLSLLKVFMCFRESDRDFARVLMCFREPEGAQKLTKPSKKLNSEPERAQDVISHEFLGVFASPRGIALECFNVFAGPKTIFA